MCTSKTCNQVNPCCCVSPLWRTAGIPNCRCDPASTSAEPHVSAPHSHQSNKHKQDITWSYISLLVKHVQTLKSFLTCLCITWEVMHLPEETILQLALFFFPSPPFKDIVFCNQNPWKLWPEDKNWFKSKILPGNQQQALFQRHARLRAAKAAGNY